MILEQYLLGQLHNFKLANQTNLDIAGQQILVGK